MQTNVETKPERAPLSQRASEAQGCTAAKSQGSSPEPEREHSPTADGAEIRVLKPAMKTNRTTKVNGAGTSVPRRSTPSKPGADASLTQKEQVQLRKRRAELIRNVKQLLPKFAKQWQQLSMWLEELKENKDLHAPYKNFPELCLVEFEYAGSTAYEYAKAGRVLRVLRQAKNSDTSEFSWELPQIERQIKPLLKVKDDAKIVEIWTAANMQKDQGGVTEQVVRQQRDRIMPPQVQNRSVKKRRQGIWRALQKEWQQEARDERRSLIEEADTLMKGLREELGGDSVSKHVEIVLPPSWSGEQARAWLAAHKVEGADQLLATGQEASGKGWHLKLEQPSELVGPRNGTEPEKPPYSGLRSRLLDRAWARRTGREVQPPV